ncbi:MAG TPA: hypothetical protein VMI54_13480 [Polyangiaceae bacterium]|nr:hypothetical protein [Polyangiaceae bacterium]
MRTRSKVFGLGVALQAALFCLGLTTSALAQDDAPPSDAPKPDAAPAADASPSTDTKPEAKDEEKAKAQATVEAPATAPAPPASALPPAELEREKTVGQIGVEELPGSAYPEPRVRGLKYSSLWLTMQGYQWPYLPWTPGHASTVVGLSGSLWSDLSYARITTTKKKLAPNLKRWAQQDRAVFRASPTYSTEDGWFAQGQMELVGQGNDVPQGGFLGQIDDLYVRVGKWNLFDLTAGRFQGWELYHYGMGLDLNTLERTGADHPTLSIHPPPIYGADFFWDRANGPGNYALHVYPTNYLRGEVLGQIGTFGSYNTTAVRPVAILDLGVVKLKAAYEYGKNIPQADHAHQRERRNGAGVAAQFVLDPWIEGGINFAEGFVDVINDQGVPNPASSTTTRSVGGFLNAHIVKSLLVGFGIDFTHWEDLKKNANRTATNGVPDPNGPADPNFGKVDTADVFNTFFAIQYTFWERYYVKFVGSHGNFRNNDESETPSSNALSNTELGGRLRFMMLF